MCINFEILFWLFSFLFFISCCALEGQNMNRWEFIAAPTTNEIAIVICRMINSNLFFVQFCCLERKFPDLNSPCCQYFVLWPNETETILENIFLCLKQLKKTNLWNFNETARIRFHASVETFFYNRGILVFGEIFFFFGLIVNKSETLFL